MSKADNTGQIATTSMYVSVEESRTPGELVPWVLHRPVCNSHRSSFEVRPFRSATARIFLLHHYLSLLRKKLRFAQRFSRNP
jgi:hypothetical protein